MIEIRIRDDKTCAVVDLNSYKNECAKVEGLSPEHPLGSLATTVPAWDRVRNVKGKPAI